MNRTERYRQVLEDYAQHKDTEKVKQWKPDPDDNRIRIIPAFDPNKTGDVDFYREYKCVFGCGKNQDRLIIPRGQFGDQDCFFGKWYAELCAKKDAISEAEVTRLTPKINIAIFIIDRKNEAAGPQVWYTTVKNRNTILGFMVDPEYGDITLPFPDPDGKGACDLKINYTPQAKSDTGFAKYSIQPARASTPLGNAQQLQEWLGEDMFEKFGIGGPTDNDWIEAILLGKEEEFQKNRNKLSGRPSVPGAPDAPGIPAPPMVPPSVGPTVSLPTGMLADTVVWAFDATWGGAPIQKKAEEVSALMLDGKSDPKVYQNGNWVPASTVGFVFMAPVPMTPPVMPPPPSAPMAPPAPELPSTMDALRAEMERLQKQAAQAPMSPAAAEIEKMLQGK